MTGMWSRICQRMVPVADLPRDSTRMKFGKLHFVRCRGGPLAACSHRRKDTSGTKTYGLSSLHVTVLPRLTTHRTLLDAQQRLRRAHLATKPKPAGVTGTRRGEFVLGGLQMVSSGITAQQTANLRSTAVWRRRTNASSAMRP